MATRKKAAKRSRVTLKMIDAVLDQLRAEVIKATAKHGPMTSAHEGHSVIEEEFDEMWDEIKVDNLPRARRECVQLGAMAVRFLLDVTE